MHEVHKQLKCSSRLSAMKGKGVVEAGKLFFGANFQANFLKVTQNVHPFPFS
jgi:hypothetical protein